MRTIIPATKWHDIGDDVSWAYYCHWGTGLLAAEEKAGYRPSPSEGQDHSGYMFNEKIRGILECCSVPMICIARLYKHGDREISSVLSYPHGITISNEYLWEIYPTSDGDIERFESEEDMEKRVKEILLSSK